VKRCFFSELRSTRETRTEILNSIFEVSRLILFSYIHMMMTLRPVFKTLDRITIYISYIVSVSTNRAQHTTMVKNSTVDKLRLRLAQ
jgi:hypothetical protein